MIWQPVLPVKLERTDDTVTAHGSLGLSAEDTHALGLPAPGLRPHPLKPSSFHNS
jgi:hypothetical protein